MTKLELERKFRKGGKRAWPNVYNILNHSKSKDLYTETTYTFKNEKQAAGFKNKFESRVSKQYENQFKVDIDGKNVKIRWRTDDE